MTPSLDDLKKQLQQLEALGQAGTLGPEALAQGRAALEKQIVERVMQGAAAESSVATAPAGARPSRGLVAGIAGFVLVFGLAGYAWLGSRDGLRTAPGQVDASAAAAPEGGASAPAHALDMGQIEGMAAKLAERLKDKPDDAEGWMMLGRSYAVLGRFAEAVPAYKRVVELRPKEAQALADYADALGMANGRSLAGEPEALIAQALQLDPKNVKALSLAGTIAFAKGDFALAARQWEVAASETEPGSELARNLQGGIAEARQRAGQPAAAVAAASAPAAAAASGAAPAAAGAAVSGRVTLAAALKAKASPDDTVFIFARPASGPKMPLAILKRQVKDLPMDFKLDDSMAMSPAARLSGAPQVVVGARISKSGNAMPQPGDLQGLSAVVAPGASGLAIEIAEEIR